MIYIFNEIQVIPSHLIFKISYFTNFTQTLEGQYQAETTLYLLEPKIIRYLFVLDPLRILEFWR